MQVEEQDRTLQWPFGLTYSDVTKLSHTQLQALAVLSHVLSPFSIIATSFVLLAIYRRKLYKSLYGRLMTGVAGSNTLAMLSWVLGPLPVLKETTGELGARGNTATCATAGFVLQQGMASMILYELFLVTYFMLTICFGFRERDLIQRFEPWIHVFTFIYVVLQSIPLFLLEALNPAGIGLLHCHIASYPPGCEDIAFLPCTRGEWAKLLRLCMVVVPGLALYAVCNLAIIVVYRAVYKRMRQAQSRFGPLTSFRSFQKVERQTVLYALLFFVSNGFTVVLPLLDVAMDIYKHEEQIYWVQLVLEIMFPLNGTLVLFVFIYSRYEEICRRNSELSRLRALQLTVFSRRDSRHAAMMVPSDDHELVANNGVATVTESPLPPSGNEEVADAVRHHGQSSSNPTPHGSSKSMDPPAASHAPPEATSATSQSDGTK